jgi:polyhydroxybutyrate depolymerase
MMKTKEIVILDIFKLRAAQFLHTFIHMVGYGFITLTTNVACADAPNYLPNPVRSAGCGILKNGSGNFLPDEIFVNGMKRTYQLFVPKSYDPNRSYPLVFRWHGYGGDGLSGGLDIDSVAGNEAIVVGADGLNKSWKVNEESADLLFFDRMLDSIEKKYCVDRYRVFSYGFSAGGSFSNLLACERGDVIRASAAIASGPGGRNCKGKVARWFLHDLDDNVVPVATGKAARDHAISINGCSASAVDAGNGCKRYQGCIESPVVWCESSGFGHNIRGDFAPEQVWKFFQQLR